MIERGRNMAHLEKEYKNLLTKEQYEALKEEFQSILTKDYANESILWLSPTIRK